MAVMAKKILRKYHLK